MTKEDGLRRLLDYVRLEYETGIIKEDSPVGIAWQDYKSAAEQPNNGMELTLPPRAFTSGLGYRLER
jgi:hypothetical protein